MLGVCEREMAIMLRIQSGLVEFLEASGICEESGNFIHREPAEEKHELPTKRVEV